MNDPLNVKKKEKKACHVSQLGLLHSLPQDLKINAGIVLPEMCNDRLFPNP